MKKKQKLAIFDVDGTIFRSSLLIQVVNKLIEVEAFPKEARQIFAREEERWLDREGDYQEYIDAVVHTFLKHLKGVYYGVLADAAEDVVNDAYRMSLQFLTRIGY